MNTTKILTASVIILLAICLFLGVEYFIVFQKNQALQASIKAQQLNTKLVAFDKMFIEKVLQSTTEVSFEDRLKLENAVVDIKDNDILTQWHNFLASKTETEAQQDVLILLSSFANKIIH